MAYEYFILEHRGAVSLLKVNRPKALNALNSALLEEFSGVLDELVKKSDMRALILTGEGDKAFIAGADIGEMSALSPVLAHEFAKKGQGVTVRLEQFPVPVIAAVNGYALGGGCEMAIACDFIIASENAVFGQPEVCLGLITGFGGAVRLADFVGWPMARELIFSGRRVHAEEALRIGLVNRVVPLDRLMEEAMSMATMMAVNSPLAIKKMKAAMYKIRNESAIAAKLEVEARAFSSTFSTYDQKEGTKAFLEKRKPSFKGE